LVFADTSGLIAAWRDDEANHAEAAEAWRRFAKQGEKILTTDLILVETTTLIRRRHGWKASRTAGEAMLRSKNIEVVSTNRDQIDAGWREFLRNPDPKLSLCDACSFVVMRERGVTVAFTLDHHFNDAGFDVVPEME
jgi:predicted nucleic acid-binding protein